MTDPTHGPDLDDYDDIARRLRGGVTGVQARHDAVAVVQHHVGRRRRRRRVVGAVASVAVAAVVVPTAIAAVQLAGDRSGVEPADDASPTVALDGTSPAAFFVQNAGGRARAQLTRYRAAAGERYYARFLWWPSTDAPSPVHAGAAVEQYDGDASDACAEVAAADVEAGGTSTCTTADDGTVVRTNDTTGPVAIDVVRQRGYLERAQPEDQVRAVTAFRTDGWAVSLLVCTCAALKDGVDLDAPPIAADELARIAAIPDWVPMPDGTAPASTPRPS